jgi:hypothetical protein
LDAFARTMQTAVDAPAAKVRRDHPSTSHAAAAHVLGRSGSMRRRVFALLTEHPEGLTDEQIQQWLEMNPSSERPRRVELVDAGLVQASGRQRRISSGLLATVWVVTAAGFAVAEQEAAA